MIVLISNVINQLDRSIGNITPIFPFLVLVVDDQFFFRVGQSRLGDGMIDVISVLTGQVAAGNVNEEVDPSPGSDSTQIPPP